MLARLREVMEVGRYLRFDGSADEPRSDSDLSPSGSILSTGAGAIDDY